MPYSSNKNIDVGLKYASGILSTDGIQSWFQEKYGLSPNQLASDIWIQEVPFAEDQATAITEAGNSDSVEYIGNVKLVMEDGYANNTLWLAREDNATANRIRNFVNPNNHTNAAGDIAGGYIIRLFEGYAPEDGGGINTNVEVFTSAGGGVWQFYYKEGALIWSYDDHPLNLGLIPVGDDGESDNVLYAQLFRYKGLSLQPTNNPDTTGQVISYNDSGDGSLEWTTQTGSGGGGSGSGALYIELSNPTHVIQCNSSGTPDSFDDSGTTFKVFRGTTQLACGDDGVGTNDPASNDTWAIQSVTLDNVTHNHPTVLVDDETITYTNITSLSANGGSIIWSVKVKDPSGSGFATLGIKQTFFKNVPGSDGADGNPGADGEDGTDGAPTYTWIKYADNATGSVGFSNSPTDKDYIGFAFNETSSTESETNTDYTWSLIKGDAGSDANVTKSNIESVLTGSGNYLAVGAGGTGLASVSTLQNSNTTKADVGLTNAEDKSSATIRSEIVDSDIPSSIARDTELPTRASLSIDNVDNTSDSTILSGNLTGTVDSVAVATLTGDVSASKTKTDLITVSSSVDLNDMQTSLDLKAPLANPAFTGTPTGIAATHVGLGNVTNESKATMFTSPAFTGTATAVGIRSDYFSGASASPKWELGTNVGNYLDIKSTSHIKMQLNDGYGNSSSEFSILDQAGVNIWSIDLSGNVTTKGRIKNTGGDDSIDLNPSGDEGVIILGGDGDVVLGDSSGGDNVVMAVDTKFDGNIKDSAGNDCFDFNTHSDILSKKDIRIDGVIKDSSGNVKIDPRTSGQTDFTGDIKVKGSSPGFIYGPDADELTIESNKDLVFTIDADDNDNGKKFIFKDASTEIASLSDRGDLQVDGVVTGKQKQVFNMSFHDDLGTTKHYMPWSGTLESSANAYQEEVAMAMPCKGRITSCLVRTNSITGNGDLTIGIQSTEPGALVGQSWDDEESETMTLTSTDDNHAFNFVFGDAIHFNPGDLVAMSIKGSSDLSGYTYWYVTTVVEFDWNSVLGTSSAEYDSGQ